MQERWVERPRSGLQSGQHIFNPNIHPEELVKLSYKCVACHKMFDSKAGLQKHIFLAHKKGAVKAHQCDQCEKSYTAVCNLRRHQKEEHMGIYKHICVICRKGFTNLGEYRGHLVKHGASKEFNCMLCGRSFSFKRQLKNHMAKMHATQQ